MIKTIIGFNGNCYDDSGRSKVWFSTIPAQNIFCVVLIYHMTMGSPEPKIDTWLFLKTVVALERAPSGHFV